MTFEVVSTMLGLTSVWTIEARNMADARRLACEEMRRVATQFSINSIRPVGYKPKKDTRL